MQRLSFIRWCSCGYRYVTVRVSVAVMTCAPTKHLFFFQAEDGIRDVAVTGVQTCALPIFLEFLNYGAHHREVFHGVKRSDKGSDDGIDGQTEGTPTLSPVQRGHLPVGDQGNNRSEEHTSELQSRLHLVCRLLLENKKHCSL